VAASSVVDVETLADSREHSMSSPVYTERTSRYQQRHHRLLRQEAEHKIYTQKYRDKMNPNKQ